MAILPDNRPRKTWEDLKFVLEEFGAPTDKPIVIGMRGYFRDSMGKPGQNDRGIYDDAIFLWSPIEGKCRSFNANTDPSKVRAGYGFDDQKGMAVLDTGLWRFVPGLHRGKYRALRQDGVFKVTRDGKSGTYKDVGSGFGINIHRGGVETTSSLGCQTIPPSQWIDFMETHDDYKRLSGLDVNSRIYYMLIERQG